MMTMFSMCRANEMNGTRSWSRGRVVWGMLLAGLLQSVSGYAAGTDPSVVVDSESGVIHCTAERLHEKTRSFPYPRAHHELYLNPPPLIVPSHAIYPDGNRDGTQLVSFQLSQDETFPAERTMVSESKPWAVFNAHRVLDSGVWYWRYGISRKGGGIKWAEPQQFTVADHTPRFVTPPVEQLIRGIPEGYPRLNLYLSELKRKRTPEQWRQNPEFEALVGRAHASVNRDYTQANNPSKDVILLYNAYVVTGEQKYQDKMMESAAAMMAVSDKDMRKHAGSWLDPVARILDACYDRLDPDLRQAMLSRLLAVAQDEFRKNIIHEENHIFDNHYWQWEFRQFVAAAVVLLGHDPCARDMVQYCYELWTSRAPQGGVNLEGNWINGNAYYGANMLTLHFIPSLFGSYANFDFYEHPWFQNAGQAMLYSFPPASLSDGFGDGHEKNKIPFRTRVAWADYLAREHQIPYAGWYAQECNATGSALNSDFLMRPYRILSDADYPTELPDDVPNALGLKDSGVVLMHSDICNYTNNLFVSMRSSPFGSGSHTLADQNSLNLQYKGKSIFRGAGQYLNFSDPHNLMSYRHSRAHNTILVDGIGQPFSTDGYGWMARFSESDSFAYALGDASMAYRGISEDPMWIRSFRKAGIEQSKENGFGPTPLNRFRRHLVLLRPNIVVVYDELGADEAVRFDWLLHSLLEMKPKQDGIRVECEAADANIRLVQFSGKPLKKKITTGCVVPPDPTIYKRPVEIDTPWNLTVSTERCTKAYILSVICVDDNGAPETVVHPSAESGVVVAGNWTIRAELDSAKPARLLIRNSQEDKVLALGVPAVDIGGGTLKATHTQSTLIYDQRQGAEYTSELVDSFPRTSY